MTIQTEAVPMIGPFPIYKIEPDRREKIIAHAKDWQDALMGIIKIAENWNTSKADKPKEKQRYTRTLALGMTALYYSDGKLRCIVMAEPVPIHPGDTHIADILIDRPGVK